MIPSGSLQSAFKKFEEEEAKLAPQPTPTPLPQPTQTSQPEESDETPLETMLESVITIMENIANIPDTFKSTVYYSIKNPKEFELSAVFRAKENLSRLRQQQKDKPHLKLLGDGKQRLGDLKSWITANFPTGKPSSQVPRKLILEALRWFLELSNALESAILYIPRDSSST